MHSEEVTFEKCVMCRQTLGLFIMKIMLSMIQMTLEYTVLGSFPTYSVNIY